MATGPGSGTGGVCWRTPALQEAGLLVRVKQGREDEGILQHLLGEAVIDMRHGTPHRFGSVGQFLHLNPGSDVPWFSGVVQEQFVGCYQG